MTTTLLTPTDAEWARIVDDITRREFIVGGVSLAVLLAACSNDDESSKTAGETSATRQVQDVLGLVGVPTEPKRVVVFGEQLVGNALLLGFPVDRIAAIAWGPTGAPDIRYLSSYADISAVPTDIGTFAEPNLEAIARLTPDLIVTFGLDNDQALEERRKLVTTSVSVFTVYNGYATLDETMLFLKGLGTALNLEAKAAEEEAKLRAVVASLRQRLTGRKVPTISTVRPFPGGQFWANSSPLLAALEVPGPRPTPEQRTAQYAEERLGDLEADFIVVYGRAGESADDARAMMEASKVWRGLPAVRQGRVRYVDPVAWLNWNVPALHLGLADIERMLLDS